MRYERSGERREMESGAGLVVSSESKVPRFMVVSAGRFPTSQRDGKNSLRPERSRQIELGLKTLGHRWFMNCNLSFIRYAQE